MVVKTTTHSKTYLDVSLDAFSLTSPSTTLLASSNPVTCAAGTHVSFHEPNNPVEKVNLSVNTFTRLRFRNPGYPLYDGAGNRFKFPYLGVYIITLAIKFEPGGGVNSMTVRLKNDVSPNQEGFGSSVTTGGGSADINPVLLQFAWRCVNLNERIEVIARAGIAPITDVSIFSGAIQCVERHA